MIAVPNTIEPGGVATPADFPVWAREPAKIVGWIVTGTLVVSAGLVELSNDVVDLLPGGWRVPVRAGTATVVTVGLIAGRLQTWLTRNGYGAPGNGKDGVYSPAGATVLAQDTAIEVAAAKNVDPLTHAK